MRVVNPRSPRWRGFEVGAWTAALAGLAFTVWVQQGNQTGAGGEGSAWPVFLLAATIILPAGGYLTGIVLTVRRSTRHLGQGILMGLTLALPLATVVSFAVAVTTDTGG